MVSYGPIVISWTLLVFCFVTVRGLKLEVKNRVDQDWAEVCRFYYSVCSSLWRATTFYCGNQFCCNFGRVPYFLSKVMPSPLSDVYCCVIRPFVRGLCARQYVIVDFTLRDEMTRGRNDRGRNDRDKIQKGTK
jgi:hypothetical protein